MSSVEPLVRLLADGELHSGERLADALRQVVDGDVLETRQRDGAFHRILELPHVARPIILE